MDINFVAKKYCIRPLKPRKPPYCSLMRDMERREGHDKEQEETVRYRKRPLGRRLYFIGGYSTRSDYDDQIPLGEHAATLASENVRRNHQEQRFRADQAAQQDKGAQLC